MCVVPVLPGPGIGAPGVIVRMDSFPRLPIDVNYIAFPPSSQNNFFHHAIDTAQDESLSNLITQSLSYSEPLKIGLLYSSQWSPSLSLKAMGTSNSNDVAQCALSLANTMLFFFYPAAKLLPLPSV
jgi:hypothetical protein